MLNTPNSFSFRPEHTESEISKSKAEGFDKQSAPSIDKLWSDLKNLLDGKNMDQAQQLDVVDVFNLSKDPENVLADIEKEFDFDELVKAALAVDNVNESCADTTQSQEKTLSPKDVKENRRISADEALEKVLNSPEWWSKQTASEEDADEVDVLCSDVKRRLANDDDISIHNDLYPEYEKMLESGEYENEEDLCNDEGLNYDEIYDGKIERYGDEYEQGFKDGWNNVDEGSHNNDAYNQGVSDAEALISLCGRYYKETQISNDAVEHPSERESVSDTGDPLKNECFNEKGENANDDESHSKEYSDLNSMKRELGKTYSEIKEDKPPNSPNISKWFMNGGTIRIEENDGEKVWTYTDSEDRSVQYVDGKVKFPPEAKHPIIGDISIGKFTGDRTEDKKQYLEKLEEEYGLTEIPEGYALHHDTENGVLQLVRMDYHKEFTHAGGHSMYKEEE